MNLANKTALLTLLITLSIIPLVLSAPINCRVYDDFSSGALNTQKWTESIFNAPVHADEHLVNPQEQAYHVKQNTEGDTGTVLTPTRQFKAGESLRYQITYHGGSGNNMYQPLINGNYPPALNGTCNFPTAGCGPIGYWNALPDVGNQTGTYKISYKFFSNHILMTTIRPDGTSISHDYISVTSPYSIGLNIHTGHNGLLHFDVDNVAFCR